MFCVSCSRKFSISLINFNMTRKFSYWFPPIFLNTDIFITPKTSFLARKKETTIMAISPLETRNNVDILIDVICYNKQLKFLLIYLFSQESLEVLDWKNKAGGGTWALLENTNENLLFSFCYLFYCSSLLSFFILMSSIFTWTSTAKPL